MKCITCKKKIIVNKETKQPYGAVSVIALPTPSSKHGKVEKETVVNAPTSWVNVQTNPLYGYICDECYSPKCVHEWNTFSAKI
mgnify:FL=1|tara:strand:+ start:4154 stop:4402 length:249 start_codon:yes stop_codon:yes gene_type:complete